jgi:hypothetical protein
VKIGVVIDVAQARGMRCVGSGKVINPTNVTRLIMEENYIFKM